jgi:hypothetical protein
MTTRHAVYFSMPGSVDTDPAYGIQQLETIAWTCISTSKQNPAPGLLTIQRLRDLLARWCAADGDGTPKSDDQPLPIVYHDDVLARLMDAFEALAIVSTEAMQHQTFAEVARSFAITMDRLPTDLRDRAADIASRVLAGLGDHVLAADLDSALSALAHALTRIERNDTAAAIRSAQAQLKTTVGRLNSRSTCVKQAG